MSTIVDTPAIETIETSKPVKKTKAAATKVAAKAKAAPKAKAAAKSKAPKPAADASGRPSWKDIIKVRV